MAPLLLIIACILWAVSFPLMKALHLEQSSRLPELSTLFLASWLQLTRFGLGAFLLLPWVLLNKLPSRNEIRQGMILAFFGGTGLWLQADSLAYTDASTSAFLTQAYCILLPLFACIKSRKTPTMRVIVATVLVITGAASLAGLRPGHLNLGRGEIETLCAAFFFTFQIISLENPQYTGNRGSAVTFIMFLSIAILFIPITVSVAPNPEAFFTAGASISALTIVGCLSVFSSVGAYLIMNTWQPKVPATEAGLIYTLEPVFTALLVLFLPAMLGKFIKTTYPNEQMTQAILIGGGMILAANILMQWRRTPHLPAAGPSSGI